jgi:hypothetical protein
MIKIPDELRQLLRSLMRQKDVSIWLIKYGALVLIFLLIYFPIQQRLSSYASNQNSLKGEIENLKKISEGFLNQKEIETMRERSRLFLDGLVDVGQATVLINKISEQALKNHLNIIQIYSDSPVPIKNDKGEDLELAGKKLNLLPISFRVDTDFKNLGAFFYDLNQASKEVYMVESIRLQKSDPSSETLQCDITLSYISI